MTTVEQKRAVASWTEASAVPAVSIPQVCEPPALSAGPLKVPAGGVA